MDGFSGGAGGAEMLSAEMQREIQRLVEQMPSVEMQRAVGEVPGERVVPPPAQARRAPRRRLKRRWGEGRR